MDVRYDRLIPVELGAKFDAVFDDCKRKGYRGINVTYPYKELATHKAQIDDPLVRSIGAINTVLFEDAGPKGFNTDYSGFKAGYRNVRGDAEPGVVCLIGTGGVGRAVAFGLLSLGATEIRLLDRDEAKAKALAADLKSAGSETRIVVSSDQATACEGVDGVVNCTPVGMVGYEGTPLSASYMKGANWAFDAVYTPVDTQFLTDAAAAGLDIISGYELFIYQGVHAWALFAEKPLDETLLRADLLETQED
ncbi:shikimate dehydrogenase [Actibacterium pelagium]|uniref:Shikimate dehydrogenase n=2 Tax=Actibacterium pelagium TaxID=2029103 RepID=A0A917ADL3_9RHOB|nr:shikimate dehydrogenase [Actibacterium pelagium]